MCLIEGTEKLATGTYAQPPGYFGVYSKVTDGKLATKISWFGCREGFHTYANPIRQGNFYFVHYGNRGVDVAHFIYRLESMLNITHKSLFKYTDNAAICYVRTAPWWLDQPMRYSFFTIAMRAALNWQRQQKMDWRTVMLSQIYAGATPHAVDRFLAGYTYHTGTAIGWNNEFTGHLKGRKLTQAELESLLIKPRFTDGERFAFIEKLAYAKWEAAGRPNSDGSDFWKKAEDEYRMSHQKP